MRVAHLRTTTCRPVGRKMLDTDEANCGQAPNKIAVGQRPDEGKLRPRLVFRTMHVVQLRERPHRRGAPWPGPDTNFSDGGVYPSDDLFCERRKARIERTVQETLT
jgi:hypothetical protein